MVVVAEHQELLARELSAVVGDDRVRDPEPEDYCWRLPTSPRDDARGHQFGMAVFHEPQIDPQAHGILL